MFLGEHQRNVDGKGRIVMPAGFRDELAGQVVITKGRDRNLIVFKRDDYQSAAKNVREGATGDRNSRRYVRTFFSSADEQTVDGKTGRILVSANLREFADLEPGGEVVVIGNFETVELWNKELYEIEKQLGEEEYLSDEEDDPRDV